jgi:hypothetical protein
LAPDVTASWSKQATLSRLKAVPNAELRELFPSMVGNLLISKTSQRAESQLLYETTVLDTFAVLVNRHHFSRFLIWKIVIVWPRGAYSSC